MSSNTRMNRSDAPLLRLSMESKLCEAEICATSLDKVLEFLAPDVHGNQEEESVAIRMVANMILSDLKQAIFEAQRVNEKIGEAIKSTPAAA